MSFFRTLNTVLWRLAPTLQGQDVERPPVVSRRTGADYAALTRAHSTQGISPLSSGR